MRAIGGRERDDVHEGDGGVPEYVGVDAPESRGGCGAGDRRYRRTRSSSSSGGWENSSLSTCRLRVSYKGDGIKICDNCTVSLSLTCELDNL